MRGLIRSYWRSSEILCGFIAAVWMSVSLYGQTDRPNIIFIMADDLGYGDLGCFGSKFIETPRIDALAEQGTRFTQFYAGSPVCAPARCVLMTGLHAGHAMIRGNSPKVGGELESFGEGSMRLSLTGSENTIAKALRRAGYATGAAGKWGIGEPGSKATPRQMGFDRWLGYLNQNHAPYYYTDFLWKDDEKEVIQGNENGKRTVYSNDLFRDFALDFIRDNRNSPFFLYLPVTIPHNLMEVPSLGDYASRDWSEDAKIYAAMVTRLDGYVGEIVDKLDRLKLTDNTILFFTSDNGPVVHERSDFMDSAAGYRGRKGSVYEGGLKVPMIARWPGKIAQGTTDDTPWMFVDVFPTLLDLAGEAPLDSLDGVSLASILRGGRQDLSMRSLYWEFPKTRLWQAGRRGDWKAIRYGMDGMVELYNLRRDPYEQRNVAEEKAGIVSMFEAYFESEHQPSPHWPVK